MIRDRVRNRALDGLGALAVLAVMAVHLERFLPAAAVLVQVRLLFDYGWIGIDALLVLAGFLSTLALLRLRGAPHAAASFFARRARRIVPLTYVVVIAVFAVAPYLGAAAERVPPVAQSWLYALFLENWIALATGAWPPNVLGHLWIVAVEVQFYALWAACVLVLSRLALVRLALALAVLSLAVRCVWAAVTIASFTAPSAALELTTFCRFDAFAAGALAALLWQRAALTGASPKHLRWWVLGASVAFIAGCALTPRPYVFFQTAGYTLLAAGFGALVLGAAVNDAGLRPLNAALGRALGGLGRYSNGMYVYHVPVLGACELMLFARIPPALRTQPGIALLYVLFVAGASTAVAIASYHLFERRFLR